MTGSHQVEREERGDAGRYVIRLGDGDEAELIYQRHDKGPMVITHTGVPPAFEGRGLAVQLVQAAIADARAEGFRITPLCTYVAAQFRRHPEWHDLLA